MRPVSVNILEHFDCFGCGEKAPNDASKILLTDDPMQGSSETSGKKSFTLSIGEQDSRIL